MPPPAPVTRASTAGGLPGFTNAGLGGYAPHMDHVFVYGSLVNARSRNRSVAGIGATPAVAHGLERSWCVRSTDLGMTSLGVQVADEDISCNGAVIKVCPEQLRILDERERRYERVRLPSVRLHGDVPELLTCWTYVAHEPQSPSDAYPIAQSYVDVALSGFLSISKDFADEFLHGTSGWEHSWINDRKQPRYQNGKATHPSDVLDDILGKVRLKNRTEGSGKMHRRPQ